MLAIETTGDWDRKKSFSLRHSWIMCLANWTVSFSRPSVKLTSRFLPATRLDRAFLQDNHRKSLSNLTLLLYFFTIITNSFREKPHVVRNRLQFLMSFPSPTFLQVCSLMRTTTSVISAVSFFGGCVSISSILLQSRGSRITTVSVKGLRVCILAMIFKNRSALRICTLVTSFSRAYYVSFAFNFVFRRKHKVCWLPLPPYLSS